MKASRPITKRFEFDAGHRVWGHEGKCACLHGHRYAAEITVSASGDRLDKIGRVVDFGVIKNLIGKWIDNNWDHNMILHQDDPLAKLFIGVGRTVQINSAKVIVGEIFGPKSPYIMSEARNATAEEIAAELWNVCYYTLPNDLIVEKVRIYETPTCWADYIPECTNVDTATV